MDKRVSTIIIILVLILVLVISVWFLTRSNEDARVCGGLAEGERGACCEDLHAGEPTVRCVGEWRYLEDEGLCRFVCGVDWQLCTQDVKLCPDGSYVARDPENSCQFGPCPSE